jgi:hypothetical protein
MKKPKVSVAQAFTANMTLILGQMHVAEDDLPAVKAALKAVALAAKTGLIITHAGRKWPRFRPPTWTAWRGSTH